MAGSHWRAMDSGDFETVFARLRQVMLASAGSMRATVDVPGRLELHAAWPNPAKAGSPMWFGAVRIGKAYVSYHLMPVYTHPDIAREVSPSLFKRMQGKSCFNFRSLDAALVAELKSLTEKSARAYAQPFDARARPRKPAP